MPKISIIIPCYNAEQFLSKTIESVLDQTFADFELLILIDGAIDNSKLIAERYEQNDDRVKVFGKANTGVSSTRNYGLEKAKGEFIYFMDSDDWIEPKLLEDNLTILESENLDFVVFGYIQDDENSKGEVISSKKVAPRIKQMLKGDQNIQLDAYHLGLLGYVWNKMYRKDFLERLNCIFPIGVPWGEDFLFNVKIFKASNEINFNEKCYYHYLNRPNTSLVKSFRDNSFEMIIQKINALEEFLIHWNFIKKNEILGNTIFSGFKYCSLTLQQSTMTLNEKLAYLRYMCEHPKTLNLLDYYKPSTLANRFLLLLIRTKSVRLINFLRKI